eukprot:scaffold4314_cov222-Chaetoceros_neogracile.AAC.2
MKHHKEKLRLIFLLIVHISCQSLSFFHISHYCPAKNPSSFSQLHDSSAHVNHRRDPRGNTRRFRSILYSISFDDDELDWDDEDDDDEFDMQHDSIHNNNPTSLAKFDVKEDAKDTIVMGLDELDDTDESYYEQLFLLQNVSQGGTKGSILDNDDDDDDDDRSDVKEGQDKIVDTSKEEKSQKMKYEQTMALRKEWKEKVHQMRNESIQTRKFKRQRQRRSKLEERASLLALRALRLQSISYHENEVDDEEKKLKPVPSLSISSISNYKRKGDELNGNEIRVQQKFYGKKFKIAQGVYIRLFEVLEEMRMESNKMASEMIADQVEEEVSVSLAVSVSVPVGVSDGKMKYISSSRGVTSRFVDDVTKVNEIRKAGMNRVVHLSLNGGEKDDELSLKDLNTEELRAILRIRGNARRRGRIPKTRSKVLEHLEESFALPLF